jgi:hypothetical protein
MKTPLHILHVEDDPNDGALVQSTLKVLPQKQWNREEASG